MVKYTREELLKHLLKDPNIPIKTETELIDLLVETQITYNLDDQSSDGLTLGQKMSDRLANFAGSWGFIIAFLSVMMIWILGNIYLLSRPFDPYPFILLNLMLSCIAALQAPIIMMSQNRQGDKDRLRSIQDSKVNLKTEFLLETLYKNLSKSINNISKLEEKLSFLTAEVEEHYKNK